MSPVSIVVLVLGVCIIALSYFIFFSGGRILNIYRYDNKSIKIDGHVFTLTFTLRDILYEKNITKISTKEFAGCKQAILINTNEGAKYSVDEEMVYICKSSLRKLFRKIPKVIYYK